MTASALIGWTSRRGTLLLQGRPPAGTLPEDRFAVGGDVALPVPQP
jgi:hypothetical protein